jgi:hypothetical protein
VIKLVTADSWFSPGTPVSSTNKTDRPDITEILLKVALNTINQTYSSTGKLQVFRQQCFLKMNVNVPSTQFDDINKVF